MGQAHKTIDLDATRSYFSKYSDRTAACLKVLSRISGTDTIPEGSRSSVISGDGFQYQTASTTSTAQTTSDNVAAASSSSAANAAGSWTFKLRDGKT